MWSSWKELLHFTITHLAKQDQYANSFHIAIKQNVKNTLNQTF